jgi:signal transduction histidine kinase
VPVCTWFFARRAWSRWDTLDVALAVGLWLVGVVMLPSGVTGPPRAWQEAALVAACAAIACRRRWPIPTVAVAATAFLGQVAGASPHWVATTALTATTYTLATTVPRRVAFAVGAVTLAVVGAGGTLLARPPEQPALQTLLQGMGARIPLLELTVIVAGVAAGDAVRHRRAYLAAVEDRARHAEHDREREARRRVAEERVRIARDLHDAVSHQLALIHVHAGVASHLFTRRPDQATAALGHVRTASRAALDELAGTIDALRQPDHAAGPVEPVAGLARLGELVAALATAGLRVDLTTTGSPRSLPAVADGAAYRIIQEALTNVCKHARTGSARMSLDYRTSEFHLVIEDDGVGAGTTAAAWVTGHGTRGMIERAAAVGGWVALGPRAEGGFRVAAVLPAVEEE